MISCVFSAANWLKKELSFSSGARINHRLVLITLAGGAWRLDLALLSKLSSKIGRWLKGTDQLRY